MHIGKNKMKGLTTKKEDFIETTELDNYDYNFLNNLYMQFECDEGALFNWKTTDSLLSQLKFHEKYLKEIKPNIILETGTHKGYYSFFSKGILPKVKIYTFGINDGSQLCVDIINEYYKEKFIAFHLGDSIKTLSEFDPNGIEFDMAWVDGGHTYECAYSDLINCARLQIPHILIDDVDMSEVSQAVNNFVSNEYENEDSNYKYEIVEQSPAERKITYIKKIIL